MTSKGKSNPDSYNYRQNLSFESEQPNFLKLLMKQNAPLPECERQEPNIDEEAPQFEIGNDVSELEAENYVYATQKGSKSNKSSKTTVRAKEKDQVKWSTVSVIDSLNEDDSKDKSEKAQDCIDVVPSDFGVSANKPQTSFTNKPLMKKRYKNELELKKQSNIKKVKNSSLLSFDDNE